MGVGADVLCFAASKGRTEREKKKTDGLWLCRRGQRSGDDRQHIKFNGFIILASSLLHEYRMEESM
jgi:hypothetical protein